MRLSLFLFSIVAVLALLVMPACTTQSVYLSRGPGDVGDKHIIDADAVIKAEILEVKSNAKEVSNHELH